MFGMLDYRAYKLLWLICLPVRLAGKLIIYGIAVASALVVQSFVHEYYLLGKLLIGWIIFEVSAMFFMWVIFKPIEWGISKLFLFIVDVVPSHGKDEEEAKAIAFYGPIYELNKKLDEDIANWTYSDTDAFVALQNWRGRWFFPIKDRMHYLVRELTRLYEQDGKQPKSRDPEVVKSIVDSLPGQRVTWFERAIVSPAIFNSIVAIVIIGVILANRS